MTLKTIKHHILPLCGLIFAFNIEGAYVALTILAAVLYFQDFSVTNLAGRALLVFFVIFFAWSIPSVLKLHSFSFAEKTVGLLVYPLILPSLVKDDKQVIRILRYFVIGVVISYICSLLAATYHYFYSEPRWGRPSDFFFHVQFTEGLFDIHPTYYSLMGCLAALFTMTVYKNPQKHLIILFLTVLIFLLNVRVVLIAHCTLLMVFYCIQLFSAYRWKSLAVLPMVLGAIYAVNSVTSSIYDYPHRQIFVNLSPAWERSYDPDINEGDGGVVMRMAIWRNALTVVEDNLFFGVGYGLEKEALTPVLSNALRDSTIKENIGMYNAHNQVISFLIQFGLTGFIVIAALFCYMIARGIKKRNWIYLAFLAVFMVCFLTESVLERMWGLTLFTFFNSLFFVRQEHE